MSSLIHSYLIDPVVRQARHFSSNNTDTPPPVERSHGNDATFPPRGSSPVNDGVELDDTTQIGVVARGGRTQSHSSLGDARRNNGGQVEILGATVAPGNRRIAEIARENGLQGLIPLDDVRTRYVFDASPVSSPIGVDGDNLLSSTNTSRHTYPFTQDSLHSFSLDGPPTRSSNPSFHASERLRMHNDTSSVNSGRSRISSEIGGGAEHGTIRSRAGSVGSLAMSGILPADDGMKDLRDKVHQIREMALSVEEQARRMHELMTADYEKFKALSKTVDGPFVGNGNLMPLSLASSDKPSVEGRNHDRSLSPTSTSSIQDAGNSYNITTDDIEPTYAPPSPPPEVAESNGQDFDGQPLVKEDPVLGCEHYKRNVKVQCNDCQRWYTCRLCHDDAEDHLLIRRNIKNMLCMQCGYPQKAAQYCKQCGEQAAVYFCGICNLWDNDSRRRIYHCPDCGICRRGEGLGKDFIHCKKCNVCIAISWASSHRCVERATECDCPICGDYMFTSSASVVAMKCGHYIHRGCYDAYMNTSYKCPICNRSAVNMELQWRKLDAHIASQPMPDGWREARAWVVCNDCMGKSWTQFHWLGNKCATCDSYNTMELKVVNGPGQASQEREDGTLPISGDEQGTRQEDPVQPAAFPSMSTSSHERVVQAGAHSVAHFPDAIARSAEPIPTNATSVVETASQHNVQLDQPQPLPMHTAPPPPSTSSVSNLRDVRSRDGPPEIEMPDAATDEQDIPDDDLTFWGDGISPPSSWSLPRALSPAGGWGSPRIFSVSGRKRSRENDEEGDGGDEEPGGGDGRSSDESMGDSETWEEEEEEDEDEDGEEDAMELLGHR